MRGINEWCNRDIIVPALLLTIYLSGMYGQNILTSTLSTGILDVLFPCHFNLVVCVPGVGV